MDCFRIGLVKQVDQRMRDRFPLGTQQLGLLHPTEHTDNVNPVDKVCAKSFSVLVGFLDFFHDRMQDPDGGVVSVTLPVSLT